MILLFSRTKATCVVGVDYFFEQPLLQKVCLIGTVVISEHDFLRSILRSKRLARRNSHHLPNLKSVKKEK